MMEERLPVNEESLELAGAIEVVSDQEGITNPYLPILKLHALGADSVYFDAITVRGTHYETLTMRFPVATDSQMVYDAVIAVGDTEVRNLVGRDQEFHQIPPRTSK